MKQEVKEMETETTNTNYIGWGTFIPAAIALLQELQKDDAIRETTEIVGEGNYKGKKVYEVALLNPKESNKGTQYVGIMYDDDTNPIYLGRDGKRYTNKDLFALNLRKRAVRRLNY